MAEVASHFVEAIKSGKMASGKSLELFPSVLTALAACESLSFGKGNYWYSPLSSALARPNQDSCLVNEAHTDICYETSVVLRHVFVLVGLV